MGDPGEEDCAARNVGATVVGHTGKKCDLVRVPDVSISVGGHCPAHSKLTFHSKYYGWDGENHTWFVE